MYISFQGKTSPYHCCPIPHADLQWRRRRMRRRFASPLCCLVFLSPSHPLSGLPLALPVLEVGEGEERRKQESSYLTSTVRCIRACRWLWPALLGIFVSPAVAVYSFWGWLCSSLAAGSQFLTLGLLMACLPMASLCPSRQPSWLGCEMISGHLCLLWLISNPQETLMSLLL